MAEPLHVRVRVMAGAKRESVSRKDETLWHICVREKAEQNMANARVKVLLATALGVSEKNVRLVKGAQTPSKVYLVYR